MQDPPPDLVRCRRRLPPIGKGCIGVGKCGEQFRTVFQSTQKIEDLLRGADTIAYQLEQSFLADSRLLTEKVMAQEVREAFWSDGGDQCLPAPLQRVQITSHTHLGKEVVLQQVGRRQLQAAGVQRLEHGVRIEFVFHCDEDDEQTSGCGLGQDSGERFAVLLYVVKCVELCREVAEALPQKRV